MSLITRKTYLVLIACEKGAPMWLALEAVATTAMEHPEWDLNELNTWEEWRNQAAEVAAAEGVSLQLNGEIS